MSNADKLKCVRLERKAPKTSLNVHEEMDENSSPEFIKAKKEFDDFLYTDKHQHYEGFTKGNVHKVSQSDYLGTTDKLGFKWEFHIDAIIIASGTGTGKIPHIIKVNTEYEYRSPYDDPDLFGACVELLCDYNNSGEIIAPNIVRLTVLNPLINRSPDSVILAKKSFMKRATEIATLLSTDREVTIGNHCESCLNPCSVWTDNKSETLLEFESTNLLNACIKNPRALSGEQLSKILASKPLIMASLVMAEKEVSERINSGDVVGKCFVKQGSKLKKWADNEETVVEKLKKLGIPKTKCYNKTLVSPAKVLKLLGDIKDSPKKEQFEQMVHVTIGAEKVGTVEEQEQISLINFNKEG